MMTQARCWILVIAGLGAALSATGCGAKPVPIKGVVTVAGKPLSGATVMFVSQEPDGKDAFGITDASGAFELTTLKSKGAMPGSYKVTIIHAEPPEVPKGLSLEEIQQAEVYAPRKPSIVPEKYSRQDQTPLTHRVPQDGDAKIDVPRAP